MRVSAVPPAGHAFSALMGSASLVLLMLDVAALQTVMRSFLGVGAPEALLVAIVALVVFGPKGLADVSMLQAVTAAYPTAFCVLFGLMLTAS